MFCPTGNGVVIHLPGLFDEAEKNLQKGDGKMISIWSEIHNNFKHEVVVISFALCIFHVFKMPTYQGWKM